MFEGKSLLVVFDLIFIINHHIIISSWHILTSVSVISLFISLNHSTPLSAYQQYLKWLQTTLKQNKQLEIITEQTGEWLIVIKLTVRNLCILT